MASVPWPADLPQQPLNEPYARTLRDNVIREPMEVGPPKKRRRATVPVYEVDEVFLLTDAQRDVFWSLYNGVLGQGTVGVTRLTPENRLRDYFILQAAEARQELHWRLQLRCEYTDA